MAGVRWEQVWSLVRREFIGLAVPRVVVMESARQLIEHTHAVHQKVQQQAAELLRQHERLSAVGVWVPLALSKLDAKSLPISRDELVLAIETKVRDMKGEVLQLPE